MPASLPSNIRGGASHDVIIVGAGAAGLMCAREAARRGVHVLLLEGGETPGRKLCLAGGGKANFSNRHVKAQYYRSGDPKGCQAVLRGLSPERMLAQIDQWNLPWEEREHGQLFLTSMARALRDALVRDCRDAGCRIVCHSPVERIWREDDGLFYVQAGDGLWAAPGLGIATGSAAWPQCGASDAGMRLARDFGHTVIAPRPALTPLLMPASWPAPQLNCTDLAGICLPVRISLASGPTSNPVLPHTDKKFWGDAIWQDDLLFTHDGISGPATLKISLFWEPGQTVCIDFAPGENLEKLLDTSGKLLARTLFRRLVPQRLADALLMHDQLTDVADRKCAELSRAQRQALAEAIHAHHVVPQALAGLKKAEVCCGGVDMREVRASSMESALVPRLWFMGEVLDVTGLLGGYNLHWAWASGMAAGRSMAKILAQS